MRMESESSRKGGYLSSHRSFALCPVFLLMFHHTCGFCGILSLLLVLPDRGLHYGGAFVHYHLPDDFVLAIVFLVHPQETIHKDSCRRFVPNVASCTDQIKAEGIGCTTFPDTGIEVVDVFKSDGVPRVHFLPELVSEVFPDFSLEVD